MKEIVLLQKDDKDLPTNQVCHSGIVYNSKLERLMVKIFQGGSTGLEQQKSKSYPRKQKPSEYIYPFIKEQIKKKYNVDLVMMAGGVGFNAVEEDAELMNREFGHKIHDNGGTSPYQMTTYPYMHIEKLVQKIEEKNLKYAILSVVDHDNVIREVVFSSEKKLIGEQF